MAERTVNPLVYQFRKSGVPRELRLMAAQGALPLKPADLVELLHQLLADPDPPIREAAQASLVALPVEEMLPILKDRETPAPVLAWAVVHREERELREVVLQNPSLPDEPVEELASTLPEHLAELVVINQVRLLRRTSLLEALESNQGLSNDQRRRLRELRETFRIGEQPEAPPPPPPAPEAPPVEAAEEAPPEVEPLTEEEAVERFLSDDEKEDTEKRSAVQRLFRMNTAEKVIQALKGSSAERAILVRDPNRIVASAVLGSPRVTEMEIERFAGMKNVSDVVLRHIASNKDFTKRYGVVSNLVKNPRTPLALAINLVPRLNPRDMKSIAVDRNVPEVIRKQAQKFVRQVATPGGAGGGKH
ncbi:MAG TPA: HEAT repeat domain-containing protein [Vicinamibacteria bacterium]|nr:HEAT repeat domain-containing protein [Vicinamibacteria bacterium]